MKYIISSLFSLFCIGLFAQSYDEGVVSTRLQYYIDAEPETKFLVYALLSDHVDVDAMEDSFDARKVRLNERTAELIPALQAKAAATQPAVLAALRQLDGVNQNSLRSFWINNAIFFEADRSAIAAISNRDDIYWMDINVLSEVEEYEEVSCAMPPSPDGVEPGLVAIGADVLWNMGYTGYGGVVFGADTGIDGLHPAIAYKYGGYYKDASESWVNFSGNGNVITNDTIPSECGDHGNHTLGTILGLDRYTNDTIGVAFGALWIGTKILCDGIGTVDNIAAFQWALNPDGDINTIDDMPDVINNSWRDVSNNMQGQQQCNSVYVGTISALEAAGIANIFSAGNEGSDASTITPPKNINTDTFNVFCVAALSSNPPYPVTGFSSRGPSVCAAPAGSLQIKPEVSAPGNNVRSCELGNDYGSKSGTSMAAPHVAGAVLLLREAFPEITGKDALRALYHTCLDLGAMGEDNDYGMGMINVAEAFYYLQNQGLVAVLPHAENDALIAHVETNDIYCVENFDASVLIENAGTEMLTSLDIVATLIEDGVEVLSFTTSWTGNLGNRDREEVPIISPAAVDGKYELVIVLQNPNGVADEKPLNNKAKETIEIHSLDSYTVSLIGVDSVQACKFAHSLLYCDFEGEGSIDWYNVETGGIALDNGNHFLTPALSFNQTYYAEVTASEFGGRADFNVDQTDVGGNEDRLIFDCTKPFHLRSVTVIADAPGTRIFSLTVPGEGTFDKFVDVDGVGAQKVIIGMDVPVGDDLEFGIFAGAPLRFSTDAAFPYDLGEVGVITGTNDMSGPLDRYIGFYNWEIQEYASCSRIPFEVVIVDVGNAPEAMFTTSESMIDIVDGGEITFTDASTDANFWSWDFGDGTTSTEQNPVHTYTDAGTYVVALTVVGGDDCSDTEIRTITVVNSLVVSTKGPEDLSSQVLLYPNPTSGDLNVAFDLDQDYTIGIEIFSAYGQKLQGLQPNKYFKDQLSIDMGAFPAGMYYVVLDADGEKTAFKVVVR